MVDPVAVKAIIAAVNTQYVEDMEEDYIGYKKQAIKTMIKHLRMWYFITTKEKLVIKAPFLVMCSDTADTHVRTFSRQLDMCHIECKDHGVTVTKDDKVDHFVS